jgi:hypothetical protein
MPLKNEFEFRQELFDFPCKDFIKHLTYPNNNRILFSGKFGIGKSYFLDYFFRSKVQVQTMDEEKFRAFHIYPINYSIASNEDIFSYIKYDVITSMLLGEIELKEYDFNFLQTIPLYLSGNLLKVLAKLISIVPKLGKPVYDSYEKIEEIRKDFIEMNMQFKEPEGSPLLKYLAEIEEKQGSIFENDVIAKLVLNILKRLKEETNKENVLIIDDLDRIDPEHIFRLLNVFAAHLDTNIEHNKLGFDKVVFVCDINNVRNIFRAKYGTHTDFNGYIDKFYSYDIYHFDNRKILMNISNEAFRNVSFSGNQNLDSLRYYNRLFFGTNLAVELLRVCISYGMISLRSLILRIVNKIEIDPNARVEFDERTIVSPMDNPLLVQFRILKEIIGGYEIMKDFFIRIPLKGFVFANINFYCNQLLYFINYQETFKTQTIVVVKGAKKDLYLKLPENVRDGFEDLTSYDSGVDHEHPPQYNFSTKEFKMLLEEFIDLLDLVDN